MLYASKIDVNFSVNLNVPSIIVFVYGYFIETYHTAIAEALKSKSSFKTLDNETSLS